MSKLDFLVLVLQTSKGFHLDSLSFQVFFYFNPYCLRGPWSIDTCRVLCFPLGFFWKVKNIVSVLFTVWNLQTGFPLKPMFSEGPSFFVLFVCNERELKMRLKVKALPTSVTVSWLVKTTYRLNISGLDFLVLVLQSSNSLNLNAFFKFASIYFFLLTWSIFSFSLCGLVFPLFCSPC